MLTFGTVWQPPVYVLFLLFGRKLTSSGQDCIQNDLFLPFFLESNSPFIVYNDAKKEEQKEKGGLCTSLVCTGPLYGTCIWVSFPVETKAQRICVDVVFGRKKGG